MKSKSCSAKHHLFQQRIASSLCTHRSYRDSCALVSSVPIYFAVVYKWHLLWLQSVECTNLCSCSSDYSISRWIQEMFQNVSFDLCSERFWDEKEAQIESNRFCCCPSFDFLIWTRWLKTFHAIWTNKDQSECELIKIKSQDKVIDVLNDRRSLNGTHPLMNLTFPNYMSLCYASLAVWRNLKLKQSSL